MLTINTNVNSLRFVNNLSEITDRLNSATKHLSTGEKITQASDNAAGLYIATGLSTRINALNVGVSAVQTGASILNIAEGSISNMQDSLLRVRDLAVQAANDIYTKDSRNAMQQEANSLIDEIVREKEGCNFNGKKLFEPSAEESSETNSAATTTNSKKDSHLTKDDFNNLQTETIGGIKFTKGVSKSDGKTYYFVDSADKLQAIGTNLTSLSKNYVMMGDVNLSSIANFKPIGNSYSTYSGTFDGNNYTISNLTINSTSNYTGLFGCTDGATIKDLEIKNANVTSTKSYTGTLVGSANSGTISNVAITNCSVTGLNETGGLAGQSLSGSSITNSYATGNVAGLSQIGGLVGRFNNGESIINSYATCDVIGRGRIIGGLVGYSNSSITNSFATGDVTGTALTGGLVGNSTGSITNSYASGDVTGTDRVGGLCGNVGSRLYSSSITNSYASGNVTRSSGTAISFGECYGGSYGTVTNTYAKDQDGEWFGTPQTGVDLIEEIDPANMSKLEDGVGAGQWDMTGDHPTLISNPEPQPPQPEPTDDKGMRIQVGEGNRDCDAIYVSLAFDLGDITVDFSSAESAAASIETIDNYLNFLTNQRSSIGASMNRLESIDQSNNLRIENQSAAKSTIMDTDYAKTSSEYIKNQILQQANASLMIQSNNINAQLTLSLITAL